MSLKNPPLRKKTPLILMFCFLFLSQFSIYAQTCDTELAYWSLDSCMVDSLYDEFGVSQTITPPGIAAVGATSFVNRGHHSCTPGVSGLGLCHAILDDCTFVDNSEQAFRFSITIQPEPGFYGVISGLSFYENAPLNFLWSTGQTGDNDPPDFYGIRVLKNNVEIFKQIEIPATDGYTLEEFDFSALPEFRVDEQATFMFELLGYCRQARSPVGFAVWDLDEIRVLGCAEPIRQPCDNRGGDMDGDGVCADQDCDDNDPNVNTFWTIIDNEVSIFNIGGVHHLVEVFDQAGTRFLMCASWANGCNLNESVTLPEGRYFLKIQTYDAQWGRICDVFEIFYIGPPPPPPGTCVITSTVSQLNCDDRGTPDVYDDIFSFNLTTDIVNSGGWGYDIDSTRFVMQPSGTTISFPNNFVRNGPVTLTIRDHDKPSCVTTVTVDPNSCVRTKPLPLVLHAQMNKGMALLSWTNNTGWKNDHFLIEKSADGINFESLGKVVSANHTDDPRHYQTIDPNPSEGVNYYRLTAIYYDKTSAEAPIEMLELETIDALGLFPNPANSSVNVSFKNLKGTNARVQIVDALGKVVKTIQVSNQQSSFLEINLDGMVKNELSRIYEKRGISLDSV